MEKSHGTPTRRTRLLIGCGMILFGIFPMLATFDVGPLGPEDINGAAWLGLASGGVFAAGGAAFLAGEEHPLLTSLFSLTVIFALAAIGNWIAFGQGERVCGASIILWSGPAEGLGCRIPFGIGALVTNAILILMTVVHLQKAAGGPPRLARTRRGAEWLFFASLAPILVPVFVVMLLLSLLGAAKTWATTGKWPRNEGFIARQRAKRNAVLNRDP